MQFFFKAGFVPVESLFFYIRHGLLTFFPEFTETDDHFRKGEGELEFVPCGEAKGMFHVYAHRDDAPAGAVGEEQPALFGYMTWTGWAVDGDACVDLLVLHHAGETQKSAYSAASTGTAHGTDVLGSKYAFQIVPVLAGAYDGHYLELAGHRDEREELIVPEAEDEAFSLDMGGIHGFAVFFSDAERGADGLIDVDQKE